MKRTYGALILAGGKGTRMGGQNKALLQLQQRTFLSRLEHALSDFEEKLISLQDTSWLEDSPFSPVPELLPLKRICKHMIAAICQQIHTGIPSQLREGIPFCFILICNSKF